jgi:hypothetical protein
MSGGDPARLAALLRLWRPVVDEIVVALDDRVDASAASAAIELADRVVRVPYAPPPERMLPFLYSLCRCEWILKMDDDEVPSVALLEGARRAIDSSVTHAWIPRRWVYGGPGTYLATHPWVPDFQLRLSLNDDRLVRFPGTLHVPIEVLGPARYLEAPLYHLDLLRPRAEREAKADEYERERPGLRAAGLAFNHAFYVPELRDTALTAIGDDDRALIEQVLGVPAPVPGVPPPLTVATRDEIDAGWPRRSADHEAELTVRSAPARLECGERGTVALVLHNRGSTALHPPTVQIGSRWDGAASGAWTPLPAPVEPGARRLVVATVQAPSAAGTHTVEIDLVHDGVRWFGATVTVVIEVTRPRRIGILARDATRVAAARLAEDVVRIAPTAEPVLVGGNGPAGYAIAPGPEARVTAGLAPGARKLRSFVTAVWRVRALRRRHELMPVDALVFAGLDAATVLERWVDLAAAGLAAAQDAPIFVPAAPPARGLLDRVLLRLLLRTRGVVTGGAAELAVFLEQAGGPGARG